MLAEGRRQAQAALDVAHEQIEQGKQQSQEVLYNQNKPIIIWHTQTASSSSAKKLGSPNDAHIYNLDIENVGTGIATNIWSVLCITGQPPFICTYSRVLVPNRIEDASFYQHLHKFNAEEIEGYSFCPQEPGAFFRVVTTYVDIFNRKHLSIFERVNLTQ